MKMHGVTHVISGCCLFIYLFIFLSAYSAVRCLNVQFADPSCRAVSSEGLQPIAFWDFGFESRQAHGRLSVVSVVWCPVEVSETGRSLVKRNPTDCGVPLCVIYKPQE